MKSNTLKVVLVVTVAACVLVGMIILLHALIASTSPNQFPPYSIVRHGDEWTFSDGYGSVWDWKTQIFPTREEAERERDEFKKRMDEYDQRSQRGFWKLERSK